MSPASPDDHAADGGSGDLVTRLRRRRLSLAERLDAIAASARALHPDRMAVVDRFVARLQAASVGAGAPQIGDALPDFMLPDHEGRLVRLADLLGDVPLVVAFHRGHWCPYCRMTVATLADVQPRLAPARIIAISAEMQRFTRRIRAEAQANFRFLSDMDADYAASLGLAIAVEPALRDIYERSGKRIPDFQGSKGWVLPVPAVFVLDRDGIVRARHVDPDYRRRMDIDELIEAVHSIV